MGKDDKNKDDKKNLVQDEEVTIITAEENEEDMSVDTEISKNQDEKILPALALRGLTVFPYMVLHFDVGREKSIAALEEAMINNQEIFLVAQKDTTMDDPEVDDIYDVGTVSKIKQLLKLPNETIRVLVEGIERGRIIEYTSTDPYYEVKVEMAEPEIEVDDEIEALMRTVQDAFGDYVKLSNKISPDTLVSISAVDDPARMADIIASNILVKIEDRQEVLEAFHPAKRLEKLYGFLIKENKILGIENKINKRVKKQIDKIQKDYYLREQIKAIKKELGEADNINQVAEEYREKIEKLELPDEAKEKALKEIDRLERTMPGSAEGSVIRTYLDWILSLPWNTETEDNLDLKHAQKVLDQDHYGLKDVKERVVEYLAVHQLTKQMKGPILCFVGPPGVGKTSIAKSIARSLNREFVRMSLGGVRDEAEIRGHRRTYVGAIPGRIISLLKTAGSKNPVFLFDEIDKMSSDFRGDPASAMLEVLDAEQNHSFNDHYLELPFDLSKIMFLTTANTLDTIPRPLLDRMEVIRIAGYTEDEKTKIAVKYLIPKQLKEHGLKPSAFNISETAVRDIIRYYTREAGVRNLERNIAAVCRKSAKKIVESNKKKVVINTNNLKKYLGIRKYTHDMAGEKDEVGVVNGLAWTAVGGEKLSVEVVTMKGTGKIVMTGQLGDVMKESAKAGISYIRSKADNFGVDPEFYKNTDIHVHVPEGAIPKDGPSAGITIAAAVVSALTNKPADKNVAMTGEITLTGRVLPIGGLKEKVLAAHRAEIGKILVPIGNKKNLEEIPDNIRRKLDIKIVSNVDEVIKETIK